MEPGWGRMESVLASFIRRGERGGQKKGSCLERWRNASAGAAGMLLGQRGSFAFLDNELISHPGPLKQQKYMLMLLWRVQRSDQASRCGPGYSFYSLPIGGKQGSDPDGVEPLSSK